MAKKRLIWEPGSEEWGKLEIELRCSLSPDQRELISAAVNEWLSQERKGRAAPFAQHEAQRLVRKLFRPEADGAGLELTPLSLARLELTPRGQLRAKQQVPQHAVSEELFRPRADSAGLELTPLGLAKLTSRIVLSSSPRRENDRNLEAGARQIVDELEAEAKKYLENNAKRTSEQGLRELEFASRQLRPHFEALVTSMQHEDYVTYKLGFLFRFVEVILHISVYTGANTLLEVLKSGSKAGGETTAWIHKASAEARWRGNARLAAKRIWQEEGPASQDDLAGKILLTGIDGLPEHRQVKRLIAAMQRDGELPRKKLRT